MTARALKAAEDNQRIAADPGVSVFVTANAGSGKTKVLVDRIARLLLRGSKPSSFLCITYTKAAAAEMQSRLFDRLGKWCVADDATLRAELDKLGAGDADLGRARALFAQALETPGGLKIQTIHAFCERLLARFPLEAGVPPGFDIADEQRAAALLSRARADAALAPDAPAGAFRRFAAKLHSEALDGLLDRLALRRADFRAFSAKHQGQIFAEAAIKSRHKVRQDSESFCRAFLAQHDVQGLREAAGFLAEGSTQDKNTADRLMAVLACIERGAHGEAMKACFTFALTGEGELRANFVTKTTAKNHGWLEPVVRRFAEAAADARDTLNAIERAEDAVATLALALKLDDAYERAKTGSSVLDFDDLIEHAQTLLQRSEAAPWVLYKLDGGLDHILIDEGQDTSPAQWDLIAPLQEEFFAGKGARAIERTVFAVGDPKQSIYAFQGADPRRFLAESQHLSKRAKRAGATFKAPVLETSFRSSPEVLQVVDAVFKGRPLIAAEPGKSDETRHLASRDREAGLVEVWPLAMRPVAPPAVAWDAPVDVQTETSVHAQLALAIARRAKAWIAAGEAVWDKDAKKLRPMRPGDLLALVRTRGALFRELIKAFKKEGFPVAGADRMTLRDELAVEDCLALMRVALDPADDLALACVLKGPWCGLDDDDTDLFPLAYGRVKNETLHARLMASTDAKYAAAKLFVSELSARAGDDPFSFLSWALESTHGGTESGWQLVFARLGLETRDPLEELLQRALRPSAYAAPTLQRFLHEIEIDAGQVKRELEAETGAVRVMTVHGAKGLEAPVVILPDCTGPVNDKPDDNLIFDAAGPYFSQREKDDDAAGRDARAAYKELMLLEHRRLLYVAMTRARDRLVVCGAQHGNSKEGETPESWRAAVEQALRSLGATAIETPFGEGFRLGAPLQAEAESIAAAASRSALPHWAKAAAPVAVRTEAATPSRMHKIDPALFSPRGDGQKRFHRGRMIHGLLERLPEVAPARREAVAAFWLARQGVSEQDAALFAREALAVLNEPHFAAYFGPSSRAEAPVVGEANGKFVRGVVDRLAVDDKRVMVLDFKTDRPAPTTPDATPDAYVLQMALYREVMRKIFPGKIVSCALLWTEAPVLMELPEARLDTVFNAFAAG
ncbi:double-strand break repair helicase AddA [Terricaulis sp.]|uniref:double-strand break repair helicase AddA n=1 Tax=Terricaulis sp. TaxID=2768686 RepID=UPI003783C9AA